MPDEKTRANSCRLFLTGAAADGGAQADPDASIGKFRSSTRLEFLGVTRTDAIANITIVHVPGANGVGDATLAATGNDDVKLTPPGGVQGAAVTILNGQTKIVEGGAESGVDQPQKYFEILRTTADNLTGTETDTLADVFNNLFAGDNLSSAEAAAGHTQYRCACIKNAGAATVKDLKFYIGTLGTQRVSGTAWLGIAGAGTIEVAVGDFTDWPDCGWCRIEESNGTLREIVYYTSRTATVLTVPAAGRERLDTTAAAGQATDKIYPVPGIQIAKEAPSAQPDGFFEDETGDETVKPAAAVDWTTGITAATGLDIGDLATLNIYGLWIERESPVGTVAVTAAYNYILWDFDAT